MIHYLPYNPESTVRVEEAVTIKTGKAFLRHIPRQHSIVIDGFAETDSLFPAPNQFSCLYATDSLYRDSNRVLNFHKSHNNQTLSVSYIAVGTVITADDMNELKKHIENQDIHGTHYDLPTASKTTKGGVMIGDNLFMQGDTLHAAAQKVDIGSGLVKVNGIIQAALGNGLHFDDLGRIEIFLGNGVVMADRMRGFRENPSGSFSVNVDNATVTFTANDAIAVKTSQGLQTTEDGVEVNIKNGLAFDADGGIFVFCGRGINYDELNRIQVKKGNGLDFDDQNQLVVKAGSGLAFTNDGSLIVTNVNQQLSLGRGLYLDSDGNLTTNPPVTQWAYHDSGYDVIPVPDLVYVDDTRFYQPNLNATRNDMFNTPEGVMELWIRCDLQYDNCGNDRRFCGFGAPNAFVQVSGYYSVIFGDIKHSRTDYDQIFLSQNQYGILANLTVGSKNHFLLHMVSHPSSGYVEVTCNNGTYRLSGNVNSGKPFDKLFVYSNSNSFLFSNFVVSNTQIPYEE